MSQVQLSPDGKYWWDGHAWQPVAPGGPPTPPKKRGSKAKWIVAGVVVLFAFGICTAAVANSGSSSSDKTAAQASTAPTAAAAKAPATQSPAPQPKVVLDVSGQGIKNTSDFRVGNTWSLKWTADGGPYGGIVQVYLYDADTNRPVDILVNAQTPANGSAGDTSPQHGGGHYYLKMNATGNWHVTVTG